LTLRNHAFGESFTSTLTTIMSTRRLSDMGFVNAGCVVGVRRPSTRTWRFLQLQRGSQFMETIGPVSPSKAQDAAESRYMMADRAHFEFVGVSDSEVQL
jgi:hypothetical protein